MQCQSCYPFSITTPHKLAKIKVASLRDIAYQRLHDLILDGQAAAGSQLFIEELAQQLGISRTPIREALTLLEAEQLVETRRNRGTFVIGLTPEKVVGLMQVREALESHAARLATPRFPEGELASLERLYQDRLQCQTASFEEERHLQVMLHHNVARHCGNEELARLIISYEERYFRYLRNAMRRMDDAATHDECREHLGIVQAMIARDAEEAARRMARHVAHGARRCADNLGFASRKPNQASGV